MTSSDEHLSVHRSLDRPLSLRTPHSVGLYVNGPLRSQVSCGLEEGLLSAGLVGEVGFHGAIDEVGQSALQSPKSSRSPRGLNELMSVHLLSARAK
jgi:hypothetical protein